MRNSIRLTSRPVLRAAYASALGTRSQEGKGGTARSLLISLLRPLRSSSLGWDGMGWDGMEWDGMGRVG